ncbi:MAG: DsrE/DsrF/DrsH-like family protein [Actinomycetota bacterium]|nr:DsrE/DsrF/DrsH-like family protein [Actinomycetota bacterium]
MAKKKLAMVVFSGDMDKLMAAFMIATGAAASDMEVTMFFTFWGLKALKKKHRTGKSFLGRLMGFMERGDIENTSPSKYSMGGLGRWLFKKMMRSKNITTLPQLRDMALQMGVNLYGCQMSMSVLEIPKEDMIDEVKGCVGVAFFIEKAQEADASLFI